MATECELKYLNPDLEAVREALARRGAEPCGVVFEENLVLDDAGRTLKKRGMLLRLRRGGGATLLTVKLPASRTEVCKVCSEHETTVSNLNETLAAMEALGYTPVFVYEKLRETWRLMDCVVCLDQLPFGECVEIEGQEKALRACATALGLDGVVTSKENYHALNQAWRRARGLPEDENFVFVEPERSRLQALAATSAGHPS
ncbi:MAG TPA: adenylate cyclase [Desulfovibrio sp.]|jgi:adenylate cyclase class 2|nr:adenylate cyclase [Desulfovibrio sp.]HBR06082.1 adenylate cyclase [Desulfovibrio sp.]